MVTRKNQHLEDWKLHACSAREYLGLINSKVKDQPVLGLKQLNFDVGELVKLELMS